MWSDRPGKEDGELNLLSECYINPTFNLPKDTFCFLTCQLNQSFKSNIHFNSVLSNKYIYDEMASYLSVWDYVIFGLILTISALIGVYYRFTGGKQKTVQVI